MSNPARLFRRMRALALVTTAFAITACSSSSSNDGDATGTDPSGGGCKTGKEAAFADPAGTAFTLPAGVTVDGDIDGDVDKHCGSNSYVEYGSDLILACVGFRNSTGTEITVTTPPGLVFIAKTAGTQNGIILHSHDLKVPANDVAYFYFRPFSLNQACMPGGASDLYRFGNVANDSRIAEVISLASAKKIDGDVGSAALGQMLWDITDGDGITDEHRAQLKAAPDL